jgi:hypothetical protein
MTDKASDELQEVNPAEEENEEEDENDYIPRFIKKVLDNPQALPREIRADFVGVFEDFEFTHLGRAKTTFEYMLVNEATKLTLSLQHLDRIERAILINQERAAVESLFRKTSEYAHVSDAKAVINRAANLRAEQYFADAAFKAKSDKEFEAAGFGPDAPEGEAYLLALPSLAVIHRQKATNRKALFGILKELESRYASRHREKKMVVKKPTAKSSESKDR